MLLTIAVVLRDDVVRTRILLLVGEFKIAVFPPADILLLHLGRECPPRVEVVNVFLCKSIGAVDELRILRTDDRPLLCLLTDGILRSVNEVNDCTSLKIVKAMCLIYHVHDRTKEAHDLIDDEIACCRLTRTHMEKEIGRCRRCRVVFAVYPLEILEFLRLLCRWKEIFPRTVAEPKRELHRLRCDADVHRALNRLHPICHIGDDLPLLLNILAFQ